ncbi:hypothetical protein FRC01_006400 [Tulasnella sp. 417]|nr:hypothetical protein FRC01_006400 [Tulasnella sp. 417]
MSDLRNSTHVLDIRGGQGTNVTMYLDYIQYTQLLPVTSSTANSSSSTVQPNPSRSSLSATSSTATTASIQSASSTPLTPASLSGPPKISTAGIIGVGLMGLVIVVLVANLAIWILNRKRKASKQPRASDIALLKFYQDIQGERVQEASHSRLPHMGFNQARPGTPYDPRRHTLLQIPPPGLTRGSS